MEKVGSQRVQKLWYFEFVISKLTHPTHTYVCCRQNWSELRTVMQDFTIDFQSQRNLYQFGDTSVVGFT